MLPLELIQIICDKAELKSQIKLIQIDKLCNEKVKLHDFYNVNVKFTDEILKSYHNVKYLNVCNDSEVTNINHMKELRILDARRNSGIKNEGIKECDKIIELNASDNPKVTYVNHMRELKKLDARWDSGIN